MGFSYGVERLERWRDGEEKVRRASMAAAVAAR